MNPTDDALPVGPSPAEDAWFTEQLELDELLDLRDDQALDGDEGLPFYEPLRGYEP